MNIKKQSTSLELAKQLKEAGYKQEGLWWWENYYYPTSPKYPEFKLTQKTSVSQESIVAPTVAELGERLPWYTNGYVIRVDKCKSRWCIYYVNGKDKLLNDFQVLDTEANARAKMWLYLKKEGLI